MNQPALETARLRLEPVDESHAEAFHALLADPELHRFVPFDPPTLEATRARCARWAKRRSADGAEIWLNWAVYARDGDGALLGHIQAGIDRAGVATVGYLLARVAQGRGFATEALTALFECLAREFGANEAKAWIDTRNAASLRLVERLGMSRVGFVKDADFFKGATSDEFVYSVRLVRPFVRA